MQAFEFRAMGSACRLVVDGGSDDLIVRAHDLLCQLEQAWSRFRDDSEISRLNRNAGAFTIVTPHTFMLVERAAEAQVLTKGRFNPLMLDQLVGLGYSAPWSERDQRSHPPVTNTPSAASCRPGSDQPIELLPHVNGVRLPEQTRFDPGGIGKGLAADVVTDFLVKRGATCTSVELGGDVRVSGDSWYGSTWRIGVANPFDPASDIAAFSPTAGAVATSSTMRRSWSVGDDKRHHLVDPETGESATTDVAAVTACSSVAWWAEIVAKVAVISGSQAAIGVLEDLETPGVVVGRDGSVQTTGVPSEPRTRKEGLVYT